MTPPLKLGIAGLGTVGTGLVRLLRQNREQLSDIATRPIEITAISARSRGKVRGVSLEGATWFDDPVALAVDPGIDVLFELVGGDTGVAREAVEVRRQALRRTVGAEELGGHPRYRERFDLAVARGVSGLSPLAEYCLPFVRLGGTFVAMKGPKAAQEMQSGARAVSILGGGELSTCQLELPFEAGTRVLVSATKQRSTPGRYPRRPGVPERRPLGEAGAHKKSSG